MFNSNNFYKIEFKLLLSFILLLILNIINTKTKVKVWQHCATIEGCYKDKFKDDRFNL